MTQALHNKPPLLKSAQLAEKQTISFAVRYRIFAVDTLGAP